MISRTMNQIYISIIEKKKIVIIPTYKLFIVRTGNSKCCVVRLCLWLFNYTCLHGLLNHNTLANNMWLSILTILWIMIMIINCLNAFEWFAIPWHNYFKYRDISIGLDNFGLLSMMYMYLFAFFDCCNTIQYNFSFCLMFIFSSYLI